MNIVIFTRTGFHHTSFINSIQERFAIACVVREAYPERPKVNSMLPVIRNIFRKQVEGLRRDEQFLKKYSDTYSAGFRYHPSLKDYLSAPFDIVTEQKDTTYLTIKCGDINSPELREFLKPLKPDIIAVLGSSVINQEMISLPAVSMINIHSGLSPYYRGTWSHGWPVVNREPEYIGVTVHHVNSGIDTGDIIYQTRPLLDGGDDLNSIFLKVIAEGIELMAKAIEGISNNGGIVSYQQPDNIGRLYNTKDLNAGVARSCLKNLENGIIGDYLSMKEERDAKVKLQGFIQPVIFR